MPIHGYPGGVITANPVAPTSTVATGVWTTEQQLQAVSQGNWPGYEYPISNSLRFNSADSAYLNRTPASASNRKTFTWSGWVKRCNSATTNSLFAAYVDANNFFLIQFRENADNGRFEVFNYSSAFDFRVETNALLRDPSAWYHIVVALDTTQATNSNRIKIYVNGTEQTLATTSYPSLDFQTDVNNTNAHNIGADGASGRYHNGYLTEVNFVDGQALTPSSFGLNDPETGVWSPKRYTGTYGTNGFYLNFSDNSNTTAATLGKDYSGNGNNWTPNNFSVTAGAGNDSLVDSPTSYGTDTGVGGTVRGNYATWNPLSGVANGTLSNGNLDFVGVANGDSQRPSTVGIVSGKWYVEIRINSALSVSSSLGVSLYSQSAIGTVNGTQSRGYFYTGQKYSNGVLSNYGTSYTNGDIIGIAVDADNSKIWFSKNGVFQASGDPVAGTNAAFTDITSNTWFIVVQTGGSTGGAASSVNFGQRAFAYTAPSGFKALCTQNLPTPTIGATSTTQANDYFNVVTFSGNGSAGSVTGVGFQPDFIWAKNRTNAYNHELWDAIRGVNSTLFSNSTAAQDTTANRLVSFNSDGFSYGTSSNLYVNATNSVSWNWKANGAGSSNTAGSITSTVSANTTSGFSIVTYTGTGANATVGHGLGVAPKWVIVRNRNGGDWKVYTETTGNTTQGFLNDPAAFQGSSPTLWNSTSPTSTVFSIGTNAGVNQSSAPIVAYCFAPVAGYSAFGSYTGNGSSDGPFIYTGFRPRYVIIKDASAASQWRIYDSARQTYNIMGPVLYASLSNAESTESFVDFTSNGFKLRVGAGNGVNDSGNTIIYAAFAESPFKFSLAR